MAEQLVDQAVELLRADMEAIEARQSARRTFLEPQHIDLRAQRGERRAQLMSDQRRELPKLAQALLEPLHQVVNRIYQSCGFGRATFTNRGQILG